MSHFYRELHDRELLTQGEMILRELQRRRLLEVFLSQTDLVENAPDLVFPRQFSFIGVEDGKLNLRLEDSFFRRRS